MLLKHRLLTRRRLLKRVCHKYSNPLRPENGVTLAEIQSGRFVIFNKPQFAFCQIQKCASTSFQNFFLALGRRTGKMFDAIIRKQDVWRRITCVTSILIKLSRIFIWQARDKSSILSNILCFLFWFSGSNCDWFFWRKNSYSISHFFVKSQN